jgi:hypothetical protein
MYTRVGYGVENGGLNRFFVLFCKNRLFMGFFKVVFLRVLITFWSFFGVCGFGGQGF